MQTRLGTVLTSAAMMDDVVGLVMIQVVAELGSGVISGATVGRPVGASVGLLVCVVVGCRWIVGPLWRRFGGAGQKGHGKVGDAISRMEVRVGQKAFLVHTGVLLALVSGASYAGTSVLLAAFLAGAAVSWWDKIVTTSFEPPSTSTLVSGTQADPCTPASSPETEPGEKPWTGIRVYEHYYAPPVTRILVPFFFASIGFSIPITQLFNGGTVWRGLVYALLMAIGKFMTGIWLLRFTIPAFILKPLEKLRLLKKLGWSSARPAAAVTDREPEPKSSEQPSFQSNPPSPSPSPPPATPQKPRSLYPPAIIGLAMIARGEIGFLIASVAEARGIFSSPGNSTGSSELYLIVIWATVLCTILGPVAVGLCVRRVKALERERVLNGGGGDGVLGSWGVEEGSG